ncbi:hypothetical protein G3578_19260 [Brevibacillus sp. SYP-B805]|nr:hypothetical protein [Brevibacillus sp. SYP-B805]
MSKHNNCPRHIPITVIACRRMAVPTSREQEGQTMGRFIDNDGFELVIWILLIIFLISIFFDEGID